MTKPLSESLNDYAIYWAADSDVYNDIPYQLMVKEYYSHEAAKRLRDIYSIDGYDWYNGYVGTGNICVCASILILLEREIVLEEEASTVLFWNMAAKKKYEDPESFYP